MRISKTLEARLAAGAPWLVAGALAGEIGWLEMARVERLGAICGLYDGAGHCAACYAAVALAITGLTMMLRKP